MSGRPMYGNFLEAKTWVKELKWICFKKHAGRQASTNQLKIIVLSSKGKTNSLGLPPGKLGRRGPSLFFHVVWGKAQVKDDNTLGGRIEGDRWGVKWSFCPYLYLLIFSLRTHLNPPVPNWEGVRAKKKGGDLSPSVELAGPFVIDRRRSSRCPTPARGGREEAPHGWI